jgi:hypothetical protein
MGDFEYVIIYPYRQKNENFADMGIFMLAHFLWDE